MSEKIINLGDRRAALNAGDFEAIKEEAFGTLQTHFMNNESLFIVAEKVAWLALVGKGEINLPEKNVKKEIEDALQEIELGLTKDPKSDCKEVRTALRVIRAKLRALK